MLRAVAKADSFPGLAFVTFLLALTAGDASARTVAHSASDLCADDADPCIVSTRVLVPRNTTLDFGMRTLQIAASGSLRLAGESIRILVGEFLVDAREDVAIRQSTGGATVSDAEILSLRSCSADSARCRDDEDCKLDECGYRVCERNPDLLCSGNSGYYSCKKSCRPDGICDGTDLGCSTNADCDFGDCGTAKFCWESTFADGPRECTTNADCELGECSIGDGSARIDGEIRSGFRNYGGFGVTAAGTVTVSAPVTMRSGTPGSYSDLWFDSWKDSVFLRGPVLHESSEPYTDFDAALDIVLDGEIRMPASGVEGYGGYLSVYPDRDAFLRADIDLSARGGGLDGGTIDVSSMGGRVLLDGGNPAKPMLLRANGAGGSQSSPGGGYGGSIYLEGGYQEVTIGPWARLQANGASPRAVGGSMDVRYAAPLVVAGEIELRGSRPDVRFSGRGIEIAESARVSLDSTPDQQGGNLKIDTCQSVRIDGQISLGSGTDATPNDNRLALDLRAGDLTLSSTSSITSAQTDGRFRFQTDGSMVTEAASVLDNPLGTNSVLYSNAVLPPMLAGQCTPAPSVSITASACPLSGSLREGRRAGADRRRDPTGRHRPAGLRRSN